MKDFFRVLVLVEDYPSIKSEYPMAYVHTRNVLYKKYLKNIQIDVLSFRASEPYIWDGINVYCEKHFLGKDTFNDYDIFLSHAPNLKNHVRFILKKKLKKVVFFIHGHEVLNTANYYPKPYPWVKKENLFLRKLYDFFKLRIMGIFFTRQKDYKFIFVSDWMKKEALKNLNLDDILKSKVIHNPINSIFLENQYDDNIDLKKYDFITVRPLDGSKYCLDMVYEIAEKNPDLIFKIIGKGDFFKNKKILNNIFWENRFYSPLELVDILNTAKAALMPTRLDAQGVMMCEMAVFGIPVVTSNLPVCLEMLSDFKGAYFISNTNYIIDFDKIVKKGIIKGTENNFEKFIESNIINSEINFFLDDA